MLVILIPDWEKATAEPSPAKQTKTESLNTATANWGISEEILKNGYAIYTVYVYKYTVLYYDL